MLVPCVGAFLLEPFDDIPQRRVILQPLPATIAIENDDRDAPEALPRNAPVRALFDHLVHPVFAPRSNPLHSVNLLERLLAQRSLPGFRGLVHCDAPLLTCAV